MANRRPDNATSPKTTSNLRCVVLRLWIWVGILTAILWAYPVAYRTTRFLFVLGIALLWAGALSLWWRRKAANLSLTAAALLVIVLISLPGRSVETARLTQDCCRALRWFRGVRYVWGGEGMLGIDCSGLARQGLIWGQLRHGLCTLNGRPIRNALWLWWNDCSALALRDGFAGLTRECFRAESIAVADHGGLQPGDLAVTADGVHVLVYLGNRTWIEADPDLHKVVEVVLPNSNPWFQVPVVFLRWKWLEQPVAADAPLPRTKPNHAAESSTSAPPRMAFP